MRYPKKKQYKCTITHNIHTDVTFCYNTLQKVDDEICKMCNDHYREMGEKANVD